MATSVSYPTPGPGPAPVIATAGIQAPVQASLWSDAWRRLRRNRLALVSAVYLVLLVAVALIALVHTPYSYRDVGVARPYSGPSGANWFGADILGRDVLSRLMVGAQISLIVGVGTQVLVLAVGVPIGLIAGYYKGWIDTVVSFVINVFYGIPDLLVAMILLPVSYTHLRAHETRHDLVCRLLLEKKK